jgi:hypothetical protein
MNCRPAPMLATVGEVIISTSSSGSALLCDDDELPDGDDVEGDPGLGDEASPTMGPAEDVDEGGDGPGEYDGEPGTTADVWCCA